MSDIQRESLRIAVVCADTSVRRSLRRLLKSYALPIESYPTLEEFYGGHQEQPFGCLIFDQWQLGRTPPEVQEELEQMGRPIGILAINTREPERFDEGTNEQAPGIIVLRAFWDEVELLGGLALASGWHPSTEVDACPCAPKRGPNPEGEGA